jgi:hypothetical protein
MTEIWTSRTVYFKPNARYLNGRWGQFFEALASSMYHRRMPFTAIVGAVDTQVYVAGWPWWIPKRWAMSSVCKIAAEHGVGGAATYAVERTVLVEGHVSYANRIKQAAKGHEDD